MRLSDIVDIAASGLEAQRVRLGVTASNLANAQSTRSASGGPYTRRDPVFSAQSVAGPFARSLDRHLRSVQVTRIVADPRPPIVRHQPGHPDADADGLVRMPRVHVVEEIANMISASRSFQANLLVLRKVREIGEAALQLGR